MQAIILLGTLSCLILSSCSLSDLKSLQITNMNRQKSFIETIAIIRGGKTILPKTKPKDNIFSISYWTKRIKSFLQGLLGKTEERKIDGKKAEEKKKVKASSNQSSSTSQSGLARIQKELQEFMSHPPSHCKVEVGSNIRQWVVTITGAEGTIYEGEAYKLQFKFPKDYPSKPPVVYFLKPVPRHVHVYSNGDICLNLLGKGWAPGMTAESIAVSILSMLSSAKEKKIPPDNALHSDNAPGMQQDNWMYHDDRC